MRCYRFVAEVTFKHEILMKENRVESSAKFKKDTNLPQAPSKNRVDTAHQNDLLNPNASDTAEAQMQAQNKANPFPLTSPTYPHRKLK